MRHHGVQAQLPEQVEATPAPKPTPTPTPTVARVALEKCQKDLRCKNHKKGKCSKVHSNQTELMARLMAQIAADSAGGRYGRHCWPTLPVIQVVNTMQYVWVMASLI